MDTLAPFRKYFRIAALACTVASAGLTAWFGINQSPYFVLAILLALFLVACSIASDYINLFVVDAWRKRDWGTLGILSMGAVFVFSLNLMSNLGSVGWQKEVTSTAARVHNTKVEDIRDGIASDESTLAVLRKQLASLHTQNGWAASAKADALREVLKEKQAAADREAGRVRCGPKCEALKADVMSLQARIGTIEQRDSLTARIAATERAIATARAKFESKEVKVDAGNAQAGFFASLVAMDLQPSDTAQTWTSRGMSALLAFGLCLAPMLFSLLGWREAIGGGTTTHATTAPAVARETTHHDVTPLHRQEIVVMERQASEPEWMQALRSGLHNLDGRLHQRTA